MSSRDWGGGELFVGCSRESQGGKDNYVPVDAFIVYRAGPAGEVNPAWAGRALATFRCASMHAANDVCCRTADFPRRAGNFPRRIHMPCTVFAGVVLAICVPTYELVSSLAPTPSYGFRVRYE